MDDGGRAISYAKNDRHEQFIEGFQGKLKGRYNLAFLGGVAYLGGKPLRDSIELDLNNPEYPPDEWCSGRDMILIFDRAFRAGVSVEKLGELVMPAYRWAHPELFEGKTVVDGFDILERAYREDTTYGGVSPGREVDRNLVRLYRTDSPLPCQYFVGVVRGVLQAFGATGEVREVACQWEGAASCCFEAHWA